MNELSGRLTRARFLRLGWFKVAAPAASYGPFHGSEAVIELLIDGNYEDVSQYLHTANLAKSTETRDDSAFDAVDRDLQANSTREEFTFAGYFDATFDGDLNQLLAGTQTAFRYYPAGTDTGRIYHQGEGWLTAKQTDADISSATGVEATIVIDGDTERLVAE